MLGKLLDGRYWIIKKCTAGGFGETYLAEDTRRPGNPVCFVKHLKPANYQREFLTQARWMFNLEAETIEKLGQHVQIPRLLAYFEQEEKFYLVQDFIEGYTLREELVKSKPWQESQVIQLLEEVLPILEFIHSQGVIHRDLKPSNLIRRRKDNKLVIVDFGAVKLLSNRLERGKKSSKSAITVGTPGYMPYEQAQGKPRFNSDIYALGAIAIQALTGTKPSKLDFDPATNEMLWEHLVSISSELTSILKRMVRYDYQERYQSASEVLQELELVQSSRQNPLERNFEESKQKKQVLDKLQEYISVKAKINNYPANPPEILTGNHKPLNGSRLARLQNGHNSEKAGASYSKQANSSLSAKSFSINTNTVSTNDQFIENPVASDKTVCQPHQRQSFWSETITKPVMNSNYLNSAKPSQNSNFSKKLLLPIGIAISIATTWPIALAVYYLLWQLNTGKQVQNFPIFLPFQNQEVESKR